MTDRRLKLAAIGGVSVMFYSLVVSTAVALFLPRITLQGMTFTVATQKLLVSGHQVDVPDQSSFQLQAAFPGTDRIYPGGEPWKEDFWVKNVSSVSQHFFLLGQLTTGNGDWALLQDLVEVNLRVYGPGVQPETGWKTLREWNLNQIQFPGPAIQDGSQERFEFQYRVKNLYPTDPDGAGPLLAGSPVGGELMGRTTGGMSILIDGRKE